MLNDFDEINKILNEMRDNGTIEPIEENDCHPMDWAEVTGLTDELVEDIYPEPMVDENGILWYVH